MGVIERRTDQDAIEIDSIKGRLDQCEGLVEIFQQQIATVSSVMAVFKRRVDEQDKVIRELRALTGSAPGQLFFYLLMPILT